MTRELKFTIPDEYDGIKLERFLRNHIGLSYRMVRSLKQIRDSFLLNGQPIRSIDHLKSGSELTLIIPEEKITVEPLKHELDIIYEDDDLIIIDKPAGLAMHPTHNHQGDTLANAVAYYLKSKNKECVFRTVGRLDKNTSGLVVCCLNKLCTSALSGKIDKEYIAIVEGNYNGCGTIDIPITRPDPMKTIRSVGADGEKAVTHWTALASNDILSMLKIKLETGRTHQIRVHFSSLGTPLAGDEMYGGSLELISRQALHCSRIEFEHPITGKKLFFSAELPDDMISLSQMINN